jgi:ABC-2 type transport system ATP-binding protein
LKNQFIGNSGGIISKGLAVDIQGLQVQYRGSDRKALDNLSFSIPKGAFYGLLGPNGAGKTTLISFLCGQMEGDYRVASVLGRERRDIANYKKQIGYAPQEIALYPTLTALENLKYFGNLMGVPSQAVPEILEWVGLTDRQNDRVDEFSGGMKRRLNLGVALLNKPDLLILDEPTVGVDPQSRNFIFDRIRELKNRGVTLIYSTHYLEEVKKLCDQVGVLQEGKLIASGPLSTTLGEDLERRYLELTGRQVS